MRPRRIAAGLAAVLLAAVGRATQPPDPAPSAGVVGNGGCAGCHGQLTDAPGQGWAVAYNTWVQWDKHRLAFQALEADRSTGIITKLRNGSPDAGWKDAPSEPRCLACHVTPTLAARPGSPDQFRGGVGCEACHTAPGRPTADWLKPHQSGWKPGGLADCYGRGAMRWLGSAADRSAACVGCHVGAPAADGIPLREVNHDLIAAGHPRLFFDYATFMGLMPPHWGETGRRQKDGSPRPTEPPADVWLTGQVAAAKATLDLYADRCKRSTAGTAVWPELADMSCYACHHDLGPNPGDRKGVWKDWIGPRLSDPLVRVLGWSDDPAVRKLVSDRIVPRERAAELGEVAASLSRRLGEPLKPDFARLKSPPKVLDWDAAAQSYYALRSVGRPDADPLRQLAKKLTLPRGPQAANSPVKYDAAAVRRLVERASETVGDR